MENQPSEEAPQPKWQPLSATDRRVAGVLVEKAKTTPEQYPLTLNALRNGCNQKSNRFPLTQLEAEQVEESLERLRHLGAVVEIQDSGRVSKFRHRMYEWLGVDKVELAIMAELLLRGPQTVGELRGRAARMEPIADINELRPRLDSLAAKGLIHYLTPQGRGCVVTHALHSSSELDRQRQQYAGQGAAEPATPRPAATTDWDSAAVAGGADGAALSAQVASLREELSACRERIDDLEQTCARLEETVSDLRTQLGG